MLETLLRTKLFVPQLRPNHITRPRLIGRLNQGLQLGHQLTLISAPAGFGKSTLLSEWITGCERPVAWLSLDEADNDPARFLAYFVAALQTIAADIGVGIFPVLQSPQLPPVEAILTDLLNQITTIPYNFLVIFDDYHVIESKPIGDALAFLLKHLPPQIHLVIATREDPPLPLARIRARSQLTELRATDLRFTLSEATDFLSQVMDLNLSVEDITALESRTEGWIAGLQLAALSMQGLPDTSSFIQSFTGSHYFVLDYLLEEVLHRQPESIRSFLLCTSILDRLCGPLCDAVIHNPSIAGQEVLEFLEHANLFINPLDHERRWYRYHNLFAELLRHRLAHEMPANVSDLHLRASDWYAHNHLPSEGIEHALAIQDWPRAAEIIERFSDELPMRSDIGARLSWFKSFPVQVLLDRPRLGLVYAWTLLMANQLDRAAEQLNQLMPLVQTTPSLLGELLVIRVMIASRRFDLPVVVELAQQALELVPPEEALPRSRILLSLGAAYEEIGGEIDAAGNAFREAYELGNTLPSTSPVGNAPLPLTALAYLSDHEFLRGNLRNASQMYKEALELAEQWGGHSSIALCLVQQGKAGLLYEWNDLDGAAHALQESLRIGDLWKSPRFLVPAFGLSALVMQARGRADDARVMIGRAEQVVRDMYATLPDLGLLAYYQILLWIAQNDFHAIAQWEQRHDSQWRTQIGRSRSTLRTVLAHARIAGYFWERDDSALVHARTIIESALEQALASGMIFNMARLLILDALALYAQRDTSSALTALRRALALAEPENYVRSFLDIGKPMKEFLSWSLESQSLSEPHYCIYISNLLTHFGADSSIEASQPTAKVLIEPLTERELQVLRLIAQGLSNREIGERLFLALSTVKGHARIIFDKLQVQRRTEAVARARDLGLL